MLRKGSAQRPRGAGDSSIVTFQDYAIDLSQFLPRGSGGETRPRNRDTLALLKFNSHDPRERPLEGEARAELYDRLTSPLYALVAGLIAFAALGEARTTRQKSDPGHSGRHRRLRGGAHFRLRRRAGAARQGAGGAAVVVDDRRLGRPGCASRPCRSTRFSPGRPRARSPAPGAWRAKGAAMMFGTLGRYLASRFASAVLGVFAAVLALIFTLDFVDTLRRAGEARGASGGLIAWLAVLHTPIVAEQALPFVVLIGAMAAFLNLSRRLELAVARAAGVSVWQFLAPALAVSLALGVVEVAAFNPLSTTMKRQAAGLEAKLFGSGARDAGGFWLRQKTVDGQSIVHVDGRDLDKDEFVGMQIYNFDRDGAFDQRVDAKSGVLREGYWELKDAEVVTPGDDGDPCEHLSAGDVADARPGRPELRAAGYGVVLRPRRAGRAGAQRRARRDALSFAPPAASRLAAVADRDDPGGRLLFLKAVPHGRSAADGFGWRDGRLRALCRHEDRWRFGVGGVGVGAGRRMVAGDRGLSVRRVCIAPPGGRLMGAALVRLSRNAQRGGLGVALAVAFVLSAAGPAAARKETLPQAAIGSKSDPTPPAPDRNPAKLYIDANKLIYDKDRDIVTADGDVVLYYKGRVLQADHVVYDRKAKRLLASGRVKLTDEHGNVTYSKRMELSDDFANGFADAVQVLTTDKTRLSSPRIERSGDAVTVLQNGVYTACEPCKAHPEMAAAVAGARQRDHRGPEHPHDLFPRRLFRRLRLPGRLYPLFLGARSDGDAQERVSDALLRLHELARAWGDDALFPGSRRRITT